jgi:dTDP-4-amino-4,6-dideoxygalactose transaminase
LAARLRMIANHGQQKKYYHDVIGVNSRLDSLQAAVLNVKLQYLDEYCAARQRAAAYYDHSFRNAKGLQIPARQPNSTHVFHQYNLQVKNGKRDALQAFLSEHGIPSMIYYPVPLYAQEAFKPFYHGEKLPVTERLCASVLALPIHTEMDEELLNHICLTITDFFENH